MGGLERSLKGVKQLLLCLAGALLWLSLGCGGAAVRPAVPPMAVKMEAPGAANRLQEQLFRQVAQVSAGDYKDYRIGPEDLLEIVFLDTDKLRAETRVNGQGQIRLMLVGDVQVAGLTPSEVAQKLTHLYKAGEFLQDPNITVAIKEFRHQRVAVSGAVNKPDYYPLIGPRTLLEVLGMAGGLSEKAGEVAHIIRPRKGALSPRKDSLTAKDAGPSQPFSPGTETIIVDMNRLLLKGDIALNFPVQNGDVVFVPFAKTAFVLGAVAKPGAVLLKDNMTVAKAIAETGGLHVMLSSNNATVLRLDEKGERQVIKVNLARIAKGAEEDLLLRENDIVFVQESGFRRFLFDIKSLMPGSVSVAPAALL